MHKVLQTKCQKNNSPFHISFNALLFPLQPKQWLLLPETGQTS